MEAEVAELHRLQLKLLQQEILILRAQLQASRKREAAKSRRIASLEKSIQLLQDGLLEWFSSLQDHVSRDALKQLTTGLLAGARHAFGRQVSAYARIHMAAALNSITDVLESGIDNHGERAERGPVRSPEAVSERAADILAECDASEGGDAKAASQVSGDGSDTSSSEECLEAGCSSVVVSRGKKPVAVRIPNLTLDAVGQSAWMSGQQTSGDVYVD